MAKTVKKVARTSEDIENDNLSKLRRIFPQFVKDGEVDFEALKNFFDAEGVAAGEERYGLNWAGKNNAFKAIRVPATGTIVPQPKESKDFDKTQNIFIEGDNLEVLKLLQAHYREQIKMIYIDPPYNTGKDFIYKDNFTEQIADYYERSGQSSGGVKLTSNLESNGRYHSDWLTMMWPRLFMARNLLREDGVIFVSIDDNEVHNLRLIMDEIFGEENFVASIIWNSTKSVTNTALISVSHTYNLVFAKNIEYFTEKRSHFRLEENGEGFENSDNDSRGPWKADPFQVGGWRPNQQYEIKNPKTGEIYKPNQGCSWKNDYKKFQELLKDNRIVFGASGEAGPQRKRFKFEAEERGRVAKTLWDDVDTTTNATRDLIELMGSRNLFDNPKPVNLIKRFIELGVYNPSDESIVLDFFAGSGTTAHAVMDLNAEDGGSRKWICVQIPEVVDEKSEAKKAGFNNIAEIARERIRRAGEKIGSESRGIATSADANRLPRNDALDVGFKSFELSKSNYRQWNVVTDKDDEQKLKKQMKLLVEKPLVDGYDEKSVVYEVLVKEGFGLNSKVEEKTVGKQAVWNVAEGDRRMVMSFAKKLTQEQVGALGLGENDIFVCLDSALDDTTKVNLVRNFNLRVI